MTIFRLMFAILVATMGLRMEKARASESEFLRYCSQSKSGNVNQQKEFKWLTRVFLTENCEEIANNIRSSKSFQDFLPRAIRKYGPIHNWLGYNDFVNLTEASNYYDFDEARILAQLFSDLTPFREFPSLTHIDLTGKLLHPCTALEQLPQLKTMTLDMSRFQEKGVDDCLTDHGITAVFLYQDYKAKPIEQKFSRTKVLGIEGWYGPLNYLQKFPDLKYLEINYSGVLSAGFEVLAPLINLTHLSLKINNFQRFDSIRFLKNIENLSVNNSFLESKDDYASQSFLKDLEFVKALRWLRELDVANNSIKDITPLLTLKYLKSVDLSNNNIEQIPDLSGMTKLKKIKLAVNRISNLESLSEISGLQFLDVSRNQITDFAPLEKMQGLQYLNISANRQLSIPLTLPKISTLRALVLNGLRFKEKYPELELQSMLRKLLGINSPELRLMNEILRTNVARIGKEACVGRSSAPSILTPENFNYPELKVLSLSAQKLEEAPDLSENTSLNYVDLSYNQLKTAPKIGSQNLKLTNLDNSDAPTDLICQSVNQH